MIHTFEDIVELSLEFNGKAYPFLKGLQGFFHDNPEENPKASEEVDILINDLDNFFAFLSQNIQKVEKKHDFSAVPKREYH